MRRKLYNPQNNYLMYLDCEANERFWDEKWEASAKITFAHPPRHRETIRITSSYLKPGSRLLEGGCGLGDVVHALDKAGYDANGIDYAPKVVSAINANWPHLSVTEGDVRHLSAPNEHYDGYWSIGVIEHFPEGYDAIASEMKRVLRKNGYLFLSFPSFNKFRRARAKAGKYPSSSSSPSATPDFFQFALNPEQVKEYFESLGFELVKHRGIGSLQCLAEDLPFVATVQRFLDRFPSRVSTVLSMLMDTFLGQYAGHSSLLILRKT